MANPTNIPGDLVVPGDLRLQGDLTPPKAKASILKLAELQSFPIPLTDFRVWDAMATALPSAGANDDLGLVGGTFGTATPSLRTQDCKTLTNSNRARVLVQLPWDYVAGESVALRFKAGMITTVSGTTATIDCEAYKIVDPADAVGTDLVSTAAQTINSLVFANVDFVVTPTSLSPGDILDVRVSISIVDGATATAVIAGITSCKLLVDVR
jgi:hypothetical protein